MIIIKNARSINGNIKDFFIQSDFEKVLDANGCLTVLPALIDPHVHFRIPGASHKEDWMAASRAAISGGVTTVFDMPNNSPSCITKERLDAKKSLIDQQLQHSKIPLRYHLFFGADQNHLDEIQKIKTDAVGIKVYMGSTTGDLLMTDDAALEKVFKIASQHNLVVAVHAEDENFIQTNKLKYAEKQNPAIHSLIRSREAAILASQKAIELAEKYQTKLFILHMSTKEEVDMVRQAKKKQIQVYAEATPHHLFLTEKEYARWGTKVQMNPPLRTQADLDALWEGIYDNTIDTIGTDHAPHTLEEKSKGYGLAPSGVPGIETLLPLLLNAFHENKISLEKIIDLTRKNVEKIYQLPSHTDVVLVDLDKKQMVEDKNLRTKCRWSPFSGKVLKGWPIYTILKERIFLCTE